MKKILISLGSLASLMPVSAIIACGSNGTQAGADTKTKPGDDQDKPSSKPSKKAEKKPVISESLKSTLESSLFKSNKDKIDLNKLNFKNKKWSDVEKDLGIYYSAKFSGDIDDQNDGYLNSEGIAIDFEKINNNYSGSDNLQDANEEITLIIKKDDRKSVNVNLHLTREDATSDIELSKIRGNVYYWNKAPDGLDTKVANDTVQFSDLGISKNNFLKPLSGSLVTSTNVTLKVKTPYNTETKEIVLDFSANYNNTGVKTKEITIKYDFLTFEAIKNATSKVVDGILSIPEDSSKDDALAKMNKLSWSEDEYKKMFINYFKNSSASFKDTYYMIKFMASATKMENIGLATMGIVSTIDGKTLSDTDKFILVQNKIYNSEFNITKTAQGIIYKFSGKDKDFVKKMVQASATVDTSNKELQKRGAWSLASPAMGGDETVAYIIGKIQYTLVDAPDESKMI